MDANAIQNDRDRISSSVKIKREETPSNVSMPYNTLIDSYNFKRELNFENCNPDSSLVENVQDVEIMNKLARIENLCNDLRKKAIADDLTAKEILPRPSLLFETNKLPDDVRIN